MPVSIQHEGRGWGQVDVIAVEGQVPSLKKRIVGTVELGLEDDGLSFMINDIAWLVSQQAVEVAGDLAEGDSVVVGLTTPDMVQRVGAASAPGLVRRAD